MATQDDYIRTALRVPADLHSKIHEAAKANTRTFNAEIVARLQASFLARHADEATADPISGSEAATLDEQADLIASKVLKGMGNNSYLERVLEALTALELRRVELVPIDELINKRPENPTPRGPIRSRNARKSKP